MHTKKKKKKIFILDRTLYHCSNQHQPDQTWLETTGTKQANINNIVQTENKWQRETLDEQLVLDLLCKNSNTRDFKRQEHAVVLELVG
jgi:hypothetical protein